MVRQIVTISTLLAASSIGCGGASEPENSVRTTSSASREVQHSVVARTQIDGRAFPDHVLALTWDDGPDVNTLALADYLKEQKIAATFFVVREWVGSFSSDPGRGAAVPNTGYDAIPILGDLVQLGHRLGNHTLNHVLFNGESAQAIDAQIAANQAQIDPFTTNELRIFRAPGGAWDTSATGAQGLSNVLDADPALKHLIGPVRWDVDRKDWENSLACRSDHPHAECEHAGPGKGSRVKPSVTAHRYLESIDEAGHGIVLFHDRVGDVGSRYALDVARALIPELEARGYVFAAPVLEFSAFTTRFALATRTRDARIRLFDLDGDGRADLCASDDTGTVCAQSTAIDPIEKGGMPSTAFRAIAPLGARIEASKTRAFELGDVDGDGNGDACAKTNDGIICLLGGAHSASRAIATGFPEAGAEDGALLLGDLDGDGKTDACALGRANLVCARSLGTRFDRGRVWLSESLGALASMQLGDVDADGRADLCVARNGVVACALSTGSTFGPLVTWSTSPIGTRGGILLGDLNGDGRADLCARRSDAVLCALSTGRAFAAASPWFPRDPGASAQLADINGDGRADLCGQSLAQERPEGGIACALAP